MKILKETHATAKFTEVSFDFSPVYMRGSGTKRETPSK